MKKTFQFHICVLALLVARALSSATPPTIAYQPRSQRVILYQRSAFGVIANGTPPLAYQWLKNGSPMQGATNDQIVISKLQFSDEAIYSVVVSNSEGTATSSNASLVVRSPKAGDQD